MSLRWSEWQSSEHEKEMTRKMFSEQIDDETEAKYVLKGILKRKGLPLTTTYDEYKEIQRKTRKGFEHDYDEAYCDRLYQNIRKPPPQKEEEKTTTVPPSFVPPAASSSSSSSPLFQTFDQRKHELKIFKSFNGIIYRDPESSLKRDQLRKRNSLKWAELRKKFNQPASIFAHLPSQQKQQQQQQST
ncbi:hypothetical protein Tco_0872739 [Tanacetum coccineum]